MKAPSEMAPTADVAVKWPDCSLAPQQEDVGQLVDPPDGARAEMGWPPRPSAIRTRTALDRLVGLSRGSGESPVAVGG